MDAVVILADAVAVVLQRLRGWAVLNIVIPSGTMTGDGEAIFNVIEIFEGFVIRLVHQIAADENHVRVHRIDLFDRLFERFDIMFIAAHPQLGVAHLDEGECFPGLGMGRHSHEQRKDQQSEVFFQGHLHGV